ncbi:hypothetical protein [Tardiphaga sp. 367_B4_N1_1]|uniref:hypothetical protein n=1 Tax=Tardiphaga sp. 367_B4_N1_1 TaxID=3240777 RepID=UPI003F1F513B
MYLIEDSEIEHVSKHPMDHGYAYVREVREKALKRYCRVNRVQKATFKAAMNRLDRAIREWPISLVEGKAVRYAPLMIRDQESGYMARMERLAEVRTNSTVAPPAHRGERGPEC